MYFKRPSFRRGGSTGIGQLTPRIKAKIGFPGFEFLEAGIQNELRSQMKPPTVNPYKIKGYPNAKGILEALKPKGLAKYPITTSVGSAAAIGAIPAYLAYMNRPRTLEEKKVMQDYGMLDETFGLAEDYNKVMKDRLDARKVGDEISFKDAIFMDTETGKYPRILGRTEDREIETKLDDDFEMPRGGGADFAEIAETVIADKKEDTPIKTDDDAPKEKTFDSIYEEEKKKIEKLIGEEDNKGMLAIALSDAIGTPGTIADKAAVLNKSLLSIMAGKKKDKKDIAKLAYTATKEIEKAKVMANKEGYSEKLANEVRKYKSVLANPTASEKAKAIARKELEILQGTIETLNPNKAVKVMKPSEARANLKDFEKKAIKLAAADKTAADYQTDLASYLADIELLTQYPELYASILRIDAANVNALGQKNGGRIGFANGTPMEESIQVSETVGQGEVPTAQTPQLSFEEIRNRLPKEITDDVVRLIAGSNEALQDFSYIRTQGDVDKFNMKYGVTLVLPQSTA